MTTDRDLLLAILSMDAYNREYDEGIEGLGGAGSEVGKATLKALPAGTDLDDWQAASFNAAACTVGSEIVIACRVGVSFLPDWPSASTQGAPL